MAKHYMDNLANIGTKVAFAAALTAALAMPASADEIEEAPAPQPGAPVVEDPAPAAVSSDVQEVASYNETVTESNSEAVADNSGTAGANESTGSGNQATAESNQEVPPANDTVTGGNQDTILDNNTTDNSNQEAIEDNEDLTTQLPEAPEAPVAPEAPQLPEVPETPEAPETPELDETNPEDYNQGVDDYNDKVDDYNENVDDYNASVGGYNEEAGDYNGAVKDYNQQVDDYNTSVGDYNGKVDEINQELQNQYDDAYQQWEDDKQANLDAQDDYQTALTNYNNAKKAYDDAKEAYDTAYAKWQSDYAAWEQKKADHEAQHGTPEQYAELAAEYEEAHKAWEAECARLDQEHKEKQAAYNKYLAELEAYGDYQDYVEDKEIYDQLVTENAIYGDVQDYNSKITEANKAVANANNALQNNPDTMEVDTLEEATLNGKLNAELAEDPDYAYLLDILGEGENGHRAKLAAKAGELETAATNLNALKASATEKGLGSAEYAAYLAAVQAYNTNVDEYNQLLKTYNDAVGVYNGLVDEYNAANKPVEDSSTSTGSSQSNANIDWGNVGFSYHDNQHGDYLSHMDVKYNAAASKNVTVETDADGNTTTSYSDNVNQYTVTGVYKDKATADAESNKANPSYGLMYSNDNWNTSTNQALKKDNANDEFGNTSWNHTGSYLDPVTGEVSFYVTLQDRNGENYGITVTMNAGSVYAEGSYYKAESNDYLKYYKDQDGNGLKTVTIDGVEYYDVSGESVFLISALTCDGMSRSGTKLKAHGLDLILNMQTMIKIHQEDNAQKLFYYQDKYLEGKLAYAQQPGDPGKEPTAVTKVDPPAKVVENPGELKFPKEPTLDAYNAFTEKAPDAPSKDYQKLDPGPFNKTPVDDFTTPAPELVQLVKLDTLAKLESLEEMDTLDYLDNKLDYKMILVIPEVPSADPDPIVIDYEGGAPAAAKTTLKKTVKIVDEKVPLAKAPKTGDLSGIWAVISGMSLGGISLLNRKRKEEE